MKQLWEELDVKMTPDKPKSNLPAVVKETQEDDGQEKQDFELARETIRDVMDHGKRALEELVERASDDGGPRYYEVVATLVKTLADTAKDLQSLHEKKNKNKPVLGADKPLDETVVNVDRAIFVGTTSELLKQVKKDQK